MADMSAEQHKGSCGTKCTSSQRQQQKNEKDAIADCIIVGGGPAGLSAALILARACRNIILFDQGRKRNEISSNQRAILGADGADRRQFLQTALSQVLKYPTVTYMQEKVVDISINHPAIIVNAPLEERLEKTNRYHQW
jgi:thioredoxin reductase